MPLISLNRIAFDYGRLPILRDADLSLEPGERASIVGRNGAGKSTIFALVEGSMRADTGTLERGRRLRIGHLKQDHAIGGNLPLFEAVRGECRDLIELEEQLHVALEDLQRHPVESPEYERATHRHGDLQHRFEALGGYELDQRVGETLSGLGFPDADLGRPINELSGGEQRIAALAAVLLQRADLLLLDEPTNHLDLDGIEWLEQCLMSEKSALLMVSHDRNFLDRVCHITFHLKDAKLTRYSGNYSFYEKERAERERLERLAYERQQEEIGRQEEYIRRNIVGQKTKQAQSRRKRLEKMDRIEKPSEERTLRVRLSPARRGSNTVLVGEKLAKAFGPKKLFKDVDMHISRGEKIGLVGPNGAGKTTLVKILTGQLPPDHGSVRPGRDVDLGFFDQHLDLVSDTHTVVEEFRTVDPFMPEGEMRGHLARFGFFSDDLDKKVKMLSGGERNRLSLLKLVYQRHNFLILDEPTNHLDIKATESLEDALEAYSGTLIVISHDRHFLSRLADRVIEVKAGRVHDFPGTWDEYVVHRQARAGAAAQARRSASKANGDRERNQAQTAKGKAGKAAKQQAPAPAPQPVAKPRRPKPAGGGRGRRIQRWSKNKLQQRKAGLLDLEARIAEAEKERVELEARLGTTHELDPIQITDLSYKHQAVLDAIKRREERWARLAEEIEAQESLGE